MTRPRIEPRSPGPLANTLTIIPMPDNVYLLYAKSVGNPKLKIFRPYSSEKVREREKFSRSSMIPHHRKNRV